jgi:hypothetical protein
MQVTNTSERTIEVRALMSANSSGNAFDLRCNVREGLIRFIQEHYPQCLPVTRAVFEPSAAKETSGLPRVPAPVKPTVPGV